LRACRTAWRITLRSPQARASAVPAAAPVEGRTLRDVGEAAVRDAEIAAIRAALRTANGNKAAAAKALQTDYKTLHLKIQRYGIRAADFKKD
jgi:DNA-binding NtrC family response regulator